MKIRPTCYLTQLHIVYYFVILESRLLQFQTWQTTTEGSASPLKAAKQQTAMLERFCLYADTNYSITKFSHYISAISSFVDEQSKVHQPGTVLNYLRAIHSYAQFLSIEQYNELSEQDHRRLVNKLQRIMKSVGKKIKIRAVVKAEEDQGKF